METLERSRVVALAALFASIAACQSAPSVENKTAATDPVPSAKPVERGAVGDSDLRVMLAELASAKACELVRGQFRPLRARSFAIRQYVKFAMTASVPGTLDIAYAPGDHIVSLWFTPRAAPQVTFTPVGDIDVDRKGLWSSVVGAVASVFGQSPEDLGRAEAKTQGGHELEKQLADGLSITIDLCTAYRGFISAESPRVYSTSRTRARPRTCRLSSNRTR